jgi:hypothetical protein
MTKFKTDGEKFEFTMSAEFEETMLAKFELVMSKGERSVLSNGDVCYKLSKPAAGILWQIQSYLLSLINQNVE